MCESKAQVTAAGERWMRASMSMTPPLATRGRAEGRDDRREGEWMGRPSSTPWSRRHVAGWPAVHTLLETDGYRTGVW